MQKEEISRFFKAIETTEFKPYAQAKNRLLIKMILYTGLRVSEALGLKLKDMVREEGFYVFYINMLLACIIIGNLIWIRK